MLSPPAALLAALSLGGAVRHVGSTDAIAPARMWVGLSGDGPSALGRRHATVERRMLARGMRLWSGECCTALEGSGSEPGLDGDDAGAVEGPYLPDPPEPEAAPGPRRCAECDDVCVTWFMAQNDAHCSEECAQAALQKRKQRKNEGREDVSSTS